MMKLSKGPRSVADITETDEKRTENQPQTENNETKNPVIRLAMGIKERIFPRPAHEYRMLGDRLSADGKSKEAVRTYKKAAKQGDATALFNLGILYYNQLKDPAKAIPCFERLLETEYKLKAFVWLAHSYLKKGGGAARGNRYAREAKFYFDLATRNLDVLPNEIRDIYRDLILPIQVACQRKLRPGEEPIELEKPRVHRFSMEDELAD